MAFNNRPSTTGSFSGSDLPDLNPGNSTVRHVGILFEIADPFDAASCRLASPVKRCGAKRSKSLFQVLFLGSRRLGLVGVPSKLLVSIIIFGIFLTRSFVAQVELAIFETGFGHKTCPRRLCLSVVVRKTRFEVLRTIEQCQFLTRHC